MSADLRVVVVDDSALYRSVLSQILERQPGVEVVARSANGKEALAEIARAQPDLVTLDVEMPVLDGIETLKRIRRSHPQVETVMCSSLTAKGAEVTLRCLEEGAFDFITKPELSGGTSGREEIARQLVPILEALRQRPGTIPAATRPAPRSAPSSACSESPRVLAIGSSTGGPLALQEIIPRLPGDFPLPVLIVQHMPPFFTRRLAESLDSKSALRVIEAEHGQRLVAGTVFVAPGGRQMKVQRGINTATSSIVVTDDPPERHCRPSVNYLFRSVADVFGGGVLAVILTGMGDDGTLGLRRLKRKGARILAQDEQSCAVFGMPREAVAAGVVDRIVPLEEMAERIQQASGVMV